jgi:hypothetical protein
MTFPRLSGSYLTWQSGSSNGKGNKVIDESIAEWLAELRRVSDQFENFVDYAVDRGAKSIWGDPGYLTADFPNGWSASAGMTQLSKGATYIRYASWCNGVRASSTHETVKNDWRAAVDRAVSGGAS